MTAKTPVKTKFKRILIIVVSLAVGIVTVVGFVKNKQPPERIPYVEAERAVRVIEVANLPLMVEASGFGSAAPAQTWSAVSNVKGDVIFRHEDLESGALLTKGTLMLAIDPAFYELALTEADAEIASVNAEVAQLKQEAANASLLLELEKERLALAEADLTRTRSLVASGAVPQASLDTQLRATLQQRQAVQSLENQANIIPIQLSRLTAQKDRTLTKRAQVESDLADTKIYAPFDLRVSDVKVELYQYINPGQLLFSGDSTDTSEVVLQVPMQNLRRVLSELPSGDTLNIAALDAYVQLVGEDQTWNADVIRIANGIDPATRTVRVVLSVQQSDNMADPVENPPLPKGMYVEGILRFMAREPRMVVPQEAIHEGWVYLVDADSRLERRAVEVGYYQDGMAILLSGLNAGETVILDDIVPAIAGTLLNPNRDQETEQALQATAAGGAL
ncbi:MAG: efflux transporter periplasmic adaptor subunit [Rhodobacteraceae bacterium]|nr:MAG: efflux transporter periplasmic adaptor subunit [Paracoccaceae bacterium]